MTNLIHHISRDFRSQKATPESNYLATHRIQQNCKFTIVFSCLESSLGTGFHFNTYCISSEISFVVAQTKKTRLPTSCADLRKRKSTWRFTKDSTKV